MERTVPVHTGTRTSTTARGRLFLADESSSQPVSSTRPAVGFLPEERNLVVTCDVVDKLPERVSRSISQASKPLDLVFHRSEACSELSGKFSFSACWEAGPAAGGIARVATRGRIEALSQAAHPLQRSSPAGISQRQAWLFWSLPHRIRSPVKLFSLRQHRFLW